MFGSASSAAFTHCAVDLLVRLRARRPDRRPAAAIEQLELNAGRVDRAAHQAAERVDLANEMTLRRAADRGIARHVRDGVRRQRAQPDVRAEPRRGIRRFAARVTGADHDDVEAAFTSNDQPQSRSANYRGHRAARTASLSVDVRSVICRCRTARRYARADRPARGGR